MKKTNKKKRNKRKEKKKKLIKNIKIFTSTYRMNSVSM